jgi:hypothetical protein
MCLIRLLLNINTYIWKVFGLAWIQERIPEICLFSKDWTVCLEYDHVLGSTTNIVWGRLYDHLNEHENFHFDIHTSSKNYEADGYGHRWIC